jgi:hypothetical protein
MNKIHTYILYIFLSLGIILNIVPLSFAGVPTIPGTSELSAVSTGPIAGVDSLDKIQSGMLKVLHTAKVVISFLAIIYIVYAGTMMVIAMGDEKSISSQKRQLMYSLIAFLFVNIPGEIYAIFSGKSGTNVTTNLATSYTQKIDS